MTLSAWSACGSALGFPRRRTLQLEVHFCLLEELIQESLHLRARGRRRLAHAAELFQREAREAQLGAIDGRMEAAIPTYLYRVAADRRLELLRESLERL